MAVDSFKIYYRRFRQWTPAAGLIMANVAVWLAATAVQAVSPSAGAALVTGLLPMPGDPSLFLTRPWTILTYCLTQYSFLHLLFNMLWLAWAGRLIELTLPGRMLRFAYWGGALTGGILFLAAGAVSSAIAGTTLCGSSASVLAALAVAAVRMPDYGVRLFLIGEVRLKWIVVAAALLSLAGIAGGNAGGVAAHAGGLAFGAFAGFCLRRGRDLSAVFCAGRGWVRSPRRRDASGVVRVMERRRRDMERLDVLLDKIRLSGYGSLSSKERRELRSLSQKIDNHRVC